MERIEYEEALELILMGAREEPWTAPRLVSRVMELWDWGPELTPEAEQGVTEALGGLVSAGRVGVRGVGSAPTTYLWVGGG